MPLSQPAGGARGMRHPFSMDKCIKVTFMHQPEGFENAEVLSEDQSGEGDGEGSGGGGEGGEGAPQTPQPSASRPDGTTFSLHFLRNDSPDSDDGRRDSPTAQDQSARWNIKMAALPMEAQATHCRHAYLESKDESMVEEIEEVRASLGVISGHLTSGEMICAAAMAGVTVVHSLQSSVVGLLRRLGAIVISFTFLPGAFTYASDVKTLDIVKPGGNQLDVATVRRPTTTSPSERGAAKEAEEESDPAAKKSLEALLEDDASRHKEWLESVETEVSRANALLVQGSR